MSNTTEPTEPNTSEPNTSPNPAEPAELPPPDPAEAERFLAMERALGKFRQNNAALVAQLETAGLSLQTARETITRLTRERDKAIGIIEAERRELEALRAAYGETEARRATAAEMARDADRLRSKFQADSELFLGERNYQERRNLALFELVDRLLIHTTDPDLHQIAADIRSGEPEKLAEATRKAKARPLPAPE